MKEWIPIPGTKKHTIIQLALNEFLQKGYEDVNMKELAKMANMTTGVIYHHFGSKANLYTVIRQEIEQRIIDRMEGAASVSHEGIDQIEKAILTGFDAAIHFNACKLLGEKNMFSEDEIEKFIKRLNRNHIPNLEWVLLPSWRSILNAVHENQLSVNDAKQLLKWLFTRKLS